MTGSSVHLVIHRTPDPAVVHRHRSSRWPSVRPRGLASGMGYTTDFLGHIDITPALNEAERTYLAGFSLTRRHDRGKGPYYVPPNPYADDMAGEPVEQRSSTLPGQPGLWCRWVSCWDGCCLALDGEEKIYRPTQWLDYLIHHFLVPGAEASTSGLPVFDDFTFDHRLDGLVIGCRRDNKELFTIRVEDSVITQEVLRPADPRYVDYPPLPYEEVIDRDRAASATRKRRGTRLRSV